MQHCLLKQIMPIHVHSISFVFLSLCVFFTMTETDRPAKLARLTHIRRGLPYMSASAMSALLADVKESGVPEVHGRKNIRAARAAAI